MASWLKVAEDLFEVVDRRAKLVASELTDEQQSDSQPSASNGREVQARKTKSKDKAQLRPSTSTKPPKLNSTGRDQDDDEMSKPSVSPDKNQGLPTEKPTENPADLTTEIIPEPSSDTVTPATVSIETPLEVTREDGDNSVTELSTADNSTEPVTSNITADATIEKTKDEPQSSSSSLYVDQIETTTGDHSVNANTKDNSADDNASLKIKEDRPESERVEAKDVDNGQENAADSVMEPPPSTRKLNDNKNDNSPSKVQDQLDEAHGLLKTTVSTGQSKEARLARVCAGLSSRLQEYKSENVQLEELLIAERELSSSYQARIKQLQKDLSASKTEVARVESSMDDALAAKNSEIEALTSSLDAFKKQASASEEKLSSLQANMDTIMRSRELTETRMMQALREELASAERRAEEERAAHNATKMAAVEREVELEHRAVEASNALARIQRTAEESTSRAMELEHKVAVLEVECASLNQELQEMETRARRGQKKSSEEANQILQMQAWQEEVERARQSQRDAESKLSSLEAELQKMRVEMAGMRRDAEHYSRHEHMELEKRYRELTDLLYHKQTQLEAMASEKAAAQFQLEKEARRLQEAQVEAERSKTRRSSSTWEEDADLKALEPLPLHHRHMAAASIQLQKAAKLLDTGAVRATRFLWRYPYARVILLFYFVFVHLFLMYILHRLQEQVDSFSDKEVAASMGLGNSSLP